MVQRRGPLRENNPLLASEWNPTKNKGITPDDVTMSSSIRVWRLGRCGHEWEATVNSRRRGVGCPFCANMERSKR